MDILNEFSENRRNYLLYQNRLEGELVRQTILAELEKAIVEREKERKEREKAETEREKAEKEREKERAEKEKALKENEHLKKIAEKIGGAARKTAFGMAPSQPPLRSTRGLIRVRCAGAHWLTFLRA